MLMNNSRWIVAQVVVCLGIAAACVYQVSHGGSEHLGGVTVQRFSQLDAIAMHEDNERIRAELEAVNGQLRLLRESLDKLPPPAPRSHAELIALSQGAGLGPRQSAPELGARAVDPSAPLKVAVPDNERRRRMSELERVPNTSIGTSHLL